MVKTASSKSYSASRLVPCELDPQCLFQIACRDDEVINVRRELVKYLEEMVDCSGCVVQKRGPREGRIESQTRQWPSAAAADHALDITKNEETSSMAVPEFATTIKW